MVIVIASNMHLMAYGGRSITLIKGKINSRFKHVEVDEI